MEQQIKREVATQTAGAASSQGRKRDVTAPQKKAGLTTQDLILVAVLLAAGAVLKLTVGSLLSSMGMKPNFIIAMYCLAIILTRPKVGQALIIGLLAGLICQVPMLNATPLLNIPSELLGALACGLLIKIPMNIGGKLDLNPLVNTFLSTVVSGGTFALLAIYINVVSTGGDVMVALATYAAIVFGTATFNAILVQVLAMPLKKVLKR
ncbi:tryptophan transporter [Eggerthella sinensis]|uniref:tryptophan transporter n=1 Tax=Eggerthella sinensis TaxID=242230 RepID=UPI00248EAA0D|nr:tryptophan transporter [Eggerthella sinensis]